MVWDAGDMEENCLHSCTMQHPAKRGRKRKTDDGEQAGVHGSNATSAIVART
jgi:hypothetical protein